MVKQKKYFIGYSFNQGFGNSLFDSDELNKENCESWLKQVEVKLKELNPHITEKIIIISIKELK